MTKRIAIIGAGLCGSMLAVYLAKRGYQIDLYEKRADLREVEQDAGRSINLALSHRGLRALERIGLRGKVHAIVLPMQGRMIHSLGGKEEFFPYSGKEGEHIHSVSRPGLNATLLDEADRYENINTTFNISCIHADLETGEMRFQSNGERLTRNADIIIGTDGAGSVLRRAYLSKTTEIRFNYSQKFLSTGYKELSISPGPNNSFRIADNALHIWPREGFMMIALPNLDRSFTVTLFLPFEGKNSFAALNSPSEIRNFFYDQFPDVVAKMSDLQIEFQENPVGPLGTIKCFPWQIAKRSLLMGDAAHAIVPFYGQGMNCAFEDCLVLDNLLEKYNGDWDQVLSVYENERKIDTDAIADLAEDNFYEMRDATADPVFNRKRRLELKMEQHFPDYYSKYSLVSFRPDLSYSKAMAQGRALDNWLMQLCKENTDVENWSLDIIWNMYSEKFLNKIT